MEARTFRKATAHSVHVYINFIFVEIKEMLGILIMLAT